MVKMKVIELTILICRIQWIFLLQLSTAIRLPAKRILLFN